MLPSAMSFEDTAPEGDSGGQTQNFGSARWLSQQILSVLLRLRRQ